MSFMSQCYSVIIDHGISTPGHVKELKLNGARGFSNYYHLSFDTKLGHGICTIFRIPCTCIACTSVLDKPWISGIT